ncbi:MAG: hypothetical protein FJ387_15120 [Verrucomicrobia bacterium]|nr:hypothetical protein [Verrucomicrobiota bacterium]
MEIDQARSRARIEIPHAWREQGQLQRHRVRIESPDESSILAGPEPEDGWIQIAVPSQPDR